MRACAGSPPSGSGPPLVPWLEGTVRPRPDTKDVRGSSRRLLRCADARCPGDAGDSVGPAASSASSLSCATLHASTHATGLSRSLEKILTASLSRWQYHLICLATTKQQVYKHSRSIVFVTAVRHIDGVLKPAGDV